VNTNLSFGKGENHSTPNPGLPYYIRPKHIFFNKSSFLGYNLHKEKIMTIPEEHLKKIEELAELFGPKYRFGAYTPKDMIQEAICIGIEGYKRWDQERPFVNFISKHMSNRLKSFKRDNYYRPEGGSTKNQEAKKRLAEGASGDPVMGSYQENFTTTIANNDILESLDLLIPLDLRRIYLRMLDGAKVNYNHKNKVLEFARELVNGKS
jgi:hypothetical protein